MKIRFRVWDGKRMLYPDDELTKCEIYPMLRRHKGYYIGMDGMLFAEDWFEGDPKTLMNDDSEYMLSTGMKDKNGKEIYEGDIYQWKHRICELDETLTQVVVLGKEFDFLHAISECCPCADEVVIIGNIYENPDLIAGGRGGS